MTARDHRLRARIGAQVRAIRDGDASTVERVVLDLSRSHRVLAPLGFVVGAFVMLFEALRLLVVNRRLLLVEILPAMWIWLAMVDLKAHVWYGRSFATLPAAVVVLLVALAAVVTTVGFVLNAVFAFAIAGPGPPRIRPAFTAARARIRPLAVWGLLTGLALGVAAFVTPRWGRAWFAVSMSVVVAVMMLTYVTVPGRLAGIRARSSRRDAVGAALVAGTLGAVVCAPGYLLGRFGIVLLDAHGLFAFGLVLLAVGFTLQAGATGAVKAVKMSAKLLTGRSG